MEELKNESKNTKLNSPENGQQKEEAQNITLPLRLFLQLLWGYKKGTELRDKAVPGKELVELIRNQVTDAKAANIFIQDIPDCESVVWQLSEWKTTGEKQLIDKEKSDKYNHNVELLADAIFKKMPVLGMPFIRQLAHNVIHNKQWDSVKMFGISEQDIKL